MCTTQLSSQQRFSCDSLNEFVGNDPTCFQLLTPDQIQLTEQTAAPESLQLSIFCQGLNVEKLWQVQTCLAECLHIEYFSMKQDRVTSTHKVATASVIVLQQENLAEKIEQTAVQLQVELMLTKQMPTLDKPGLLLMDMDSTVIDVECIDEIAKLAGVGAQVAEVTELAMQGKLDFAESLRNRVACLKGAEQAILQQVRDALPLMPGLENLVTRLKSKGWKVAIASGGFTYFADYLKYRLGLHAAVANQLEIADGRLTGKVQGEIVDAQVKAQTLQTLAEQWGIDASQTIAMGDGANDLVMMEAAALGVAFHAKPIVRTQADVAIRFGGLDTLLCLLDN